MGDRHGEASGPDKVNSLLALLAKVRSLKDAIGNDESMVLLRLQEAEAQIERMLDETVAARVHWAALGSAGTSRH